MASDSLIALNTNPPPPIDDINRTKSVPDDIEGRVKLHAYQGGFPYTTVRNVEEITRTYGEFYFTTSLLKLTV